MNTRILEQNAETDSVPNHLQHPHACIIRHRLSL